MASNDPFTSLYEMMRHAHRIHQQDLQSLEKQCSKAQNPQDLHRLAANIRSFCRGLHAHHTIEDNRLFPHIARKTDISHLETHHQQLSVLLTEFEQCSNHLQRLVQPNEDIRRVIADTNGMITRVAALVNEHERAEEQVIEPSNMKKWFTHKEMTEFFHL